MKAGACVIYSSQTCALTAPSGGGLVVGVIQDYFTKCVEAIPLPHEQALTVAEVLVSEWMCRFGAPHTLHSDQGRNFVCEVFQKMCMLFGIEKTHTAPFRPQSDNT